MICMKIIGLRNMKDLKWRMKKICKNWGFGKVASKIYKSFGVGYEYNRKIGLYFKIVGMKQRTDGQFSIENTK